MRRPLPVLLLLGSCVACTGDTDDVRDYRLGSETYPGIPDCKQAYFNGKKIPGVFLKKLVRADGARLEGIACHDRSVVVDGVTGDLKEGTL